jgi:energy-coupling factor transporter ATP-binding protein EcfA2
MAKLPVDTAVVVEIGPCIDDTDFKTLETTIVYNAAGMSVDLLKNSGAAITKVDITPTSGGANDWTHKGNGVYELEITAAQNDTEGTLRVVGICDGVLVFESPVYEVVPTQVYNSLIAGTDNLQVDATQIEGADATDGLDSAAQTGAQAAIVANKLDHLVAVADVDDVADNSIIAKLAATGGDWSTFVNANHCLEEISGDVASVKSDTGNILTDTAEIGVGGAGLTAIPKPQVTLTGTASAGSATTITLTGGVATTGYYDGQLVIITGGTGVGQSRTVLSYDGASAIATVTRDWATAPAADSVFSVVGGDVPAILEAGTATAGGAATITLDASASATQNIYKSNYVMITGGTGVGQARLITAYVGATKVATVVPNWVTNPAAGSVYQIVPGGQVNVGEWIGDPVTLSTGNMPDVNVSEWNDVLLSTTNPLPNAAADAAGGLPISDAGGLDMDAIPTAAADAVWDEDIVAAHGTADTGGYLLNVLGKDISQRTNSKSLNTLLGVADQASQDMIVAVREAMGVFRGTVGSYAPASTTLVIDTLSPTTVATQKDNLFVNSTVFVADGGNGSGETRIITAQTYDDGTGDYTLTIDRAFNNAPGATDIVLIFPDYKKTDAKDQTNAESGCIDAIEASTMAVEANGLDAGAITAAAANKIADHIIRRTFANAAASADGDAKSFRSLLGAIAKLVNKIAVSSGTLTINEADDSTPLGTQELTTDAAAEPITIADTN